MVEPLLQVRGLTKRFGRSGVPAVAGASFALERGETFYSQNLGLPELREDLARYTSALHPPVEAGRIVVTSGGVNGLMLAAQALVDAGDEVVVVTPVWPNLVAQPAIIRQTAHQNMRLVRRRGHFPPIQIDGQRHISLRGEIFCLVLHPVVQSPIFMNHDDGRMLAAALRQSQKAAHGVPAAFVGNGFCFYRGPPQHEHGPTK